MAAFEIGLRQHCDQLLATIACRKILVADPLAQCLGHQAQHLITDTVTVIVIELLEVIDVDQQDAERLVPLHRLDLGVTEKFLERAAIWQTSQRIGARALLRFVERVSDRVELARLLGEARFELGRPRGGLGEFADEILDQDLRIDTLLAALGDAVDRRHMRAVVGDGGGQIALGGIHHAMQLLRDLMDDSRFRSLLADIGVEQRLVCGLVELPLVADKNVDGTLQVRRRSQRVLEPQMEVVRRGGHALLSHGTHGLVRDRRRVLEVKLVERSAGHDAECSKMLAGDLDYALSLPFKS
jgi:hypothetical protein